MLNSRNICFWVFLMRLLVQSACDRRIVDNCTVQKMDGSSTFILICTIQEGKLLDDIVSSSSITMEKLFGKRRRFAREARVDNGGLHRQFFVKKPKTNCCPCSSSTNEPKVYWWNDCAWLASVVLTSCYLYLFILIYYKCTMRSLRNSLW